MLKYRTDYHFANTLKVAHFYVPIEKDPRDSLIWDLQEGVDETIAFP
jgi:hypothetical protein